MNDIIRIAAFLKARLPKLGAMRGRSGREGLLMWLAWHTSRCNVCAVRTKDDRFIAAGVARAVREELDSRFPYKSDEAGTILHVEHVAATSNEGFIQLLKFVRKRWPQCKRIMFQRTKNGCKQKVYDMEIFMRKAGIA